MTMVIVIDSHSTVPGALCAMMTRELQVTACPLNIGDLAPGEMAERVADAQAAAIIIPVRLSPGRRQRIGLRVAEYLRSEHHFLGPVVLWSFESSQQLEQEFPVLKKDRQMTVFRAPTFPWNDLDKALEGPPLTQGELQDVIRRCTVVREEYSLRLHDLANHAAAGRRELLCQGLEDMRERLVTHQMDEFSGLLKGVLTTVRRSDDKLNLVRSLGGLRSALMGALGVAALPPLDPALVEKAKSLPPPEGYKFLVVVDDDCQEALRDSLRDLGYDAEALRDARTAKILLEVEPPQVVLCDYRLENDPARGLEVMEAFLAHSKVRLVLAASANPEMLLEAGLPTGVRICHDKYDPAVVHTAICQAAGKLD